MAYLKLIIKVPQSIFPVVTEGMTGEFSAIPQHKIVKANEVESYWIVTIESTPMSNA